MRLRPIGDDDELFHIAEWSHAVRSIGEQHTPTVAFFMLRHLTELVLKRVVNEVTRTQPPTIHRLMQLVELLPADDPLRTGRSEDERRIRELAAAVDKIDDDGTAARYAFDRHGRESFTDEACIRREEVIELAEVLWDYCIVRAGGWHAPQERPTE